MTSIYQELINLINKKNKIDVKYFIKNNYDKISLDKFLIRILIINNNYEAIKYINRLKNGKNYDLILNLYNQGILDTNTLKFIIDNDTVIDISCHFLKFFKDNRSDLITFIIKEYLFNNDFILNMLKLYKYKNAISNKKLKKLILKEKNKIDLDVKDEDGKPLLFFAFRNRSIDMIKLLIEYGADINIEDNFGETLLFWVFNYHCFEEDIEMIKYFVEHGANVNKKNNKKESPLFSACLNGCSFEVIEYLVEQGANINEKNSQYESPIFNAC
eukprot:jgi/Orpsp1_1/1191750/evm.model.d7180000088257.1